MNLHRMVVVGPAALGAAPGSVTPSLAQTPGKKPNILVIWGDDIGVSNISAYNLGLMGYKTPGIDRIAKECRHHAPGDSSESSALIKARKHERR